jgi:hypothetical protein
MTEQFVPVDDPDYLRYLYVAQTEPDPRVRQIAGSIVSLCPRAIRHDAAAKITYLGGPTIAYLTNASVAAVENSPAYIRHIVQAEQAKDHLIDSDNALREVTRHRAELPNQPVTGGHGRHVTPAENRQHLTNLQQVAHHRIAGGNREHAEDGQIGWIGHIAAVVVAGIELMVTTRIFNISFTHLIWLNFIAWLALTVGLIWFDIHVSQWYGRRRRTVRNLVRAAEALTPIAVSRSRNHGGAA